jgi:hypothetical protein
VIAEKTFDHRIGTQGIHCFLEDQLNEMFLHMGLLTVTQLLSSSKIRAHNSVTLQN